MDIAGWILLDDIWYYLEESGTMSTGWQEIDGDWYYFDEYGRMYSNMYEVSEPSDVSLCDGRVHVREYLHL